MGTAFDGDEQRAAAYTADRASSHTADRAAAYTADRASSHTASDVVMAPTLAVHVQRLDPLAPLPTYAHPGDAGADIVTTEAAVLQPGDRAVLRTGLAMAVPYGYAAFVHPRSGLAARAGMTLVNAPGTIDAGYRGEVQVIVINHDPVRPLRLERGDRIGQLVIQRVEHAEFVEVAALPESVRGSGGHGSTGGAAALAARTAEEGF